MVLENYCGHTVWDLELTWDTVDPIFTPCFSATFLTWIPSLLIWISAPFIIFNLRSKPSEPLPWTFLNIGKLGLCCFLFITSGYEFSSRFLDLFQNRQVYPVEYQSPLIRCITFLLSFTIMVMHRRKGVHTSGVLFLFWFLIAIQSSVRYWTIISTLRDPLDKDWTIEKSDLIQGSIEAPAGICLFLLSCFADTRREKFLAAAPKNECPMVGASFFSQLIFSWYASMAYLGFKRDLTQEDMWSLPSGHKAQVIDGRISKHINLKNRPGKDSSKFSTIPVKIQQNIPIFTVLLKTFWLPLTLCAILRFLASFLTFGSPVLLDSLLSFVASDDPAWRGYSIAMGMFVFALIQSFVDNQYQFWIQDVGLRMKTALITTIYQKSLRLSSEGRKSFTTGEILNLMGVDTARVVAFINQCNFLWSVPIQMGMSLYLLWNQLGLASLGGLIFMLLLIPFNGFIAYKMKNIQRRVMKEKDKRSKMMNEILGGMKVLKLYAWEGAFGDIVKQIRGQEISALKTQTIYSAGTSFAFFSAPFFVALISFSTFVLSDPSHVLDANKAFVSLSLFNILNGSLTMLPRVLTFSANFFVSIKRINRYLNGDELDPEIIEHQPDKQNAVSINKASFSWFKDDQPALKDISMSAKRGELVAIVGTVGSGKSSLLSALLGDLFKLKGTANVSGSLAYVPQAAWIQNATVRKNITFSEAYQTEKYERVLKACALEADLKILPGGDQTEIGEKGINLSGGQKQRVSLARAVYANSDVYLLDDPLSAVDAHVSKHLFEQVIGPNGLLKNKTRLLVTHRITFLPRVDHIIVMKDGQIYEQGTYSELIGKKGEFAEFIVQYLTDLHEDEITDEDPEIIEKIKEVVKPELEKRISLSKSETEGEQSEASGVRRRRTVSSGRTRRSTIHKEHETAKPPGPPKDFKLMTKEGAQTGSVNRRVYLDYFKAVGPWTCVLILISFCVVNGLSVGRSLWLTAWSDDSLDSNNLNDTSLRNMRLGVYAAIGGVETLFTLGNSLIMNIAVLHGSQLIHDMMLDRIIRAPMAFFDTTPMGRVLNRFTGDIDTTDSTIGFNFRMMMSQLLRGIMSIGVICLETPYFILVIAIMAVIYVLLQKFYIASSRQLRRIDSAARSPVYSHFAETVSGATTIRAYKSDDHFIQECFHRVDNSNSCSFPNIVSGRWLSVRLQFLGNILIVLSALFAVASRKTLSPGLTGLFVNYASQVTGILNMLVSSVIDVETNIVSVERCLEFTKIPIESPWIIEGNRPRPTWPDKGRVVFNKYSTRYRPGLDLVLQDISFAINPCEKIGIVGRTGAGKSSLTLAVFRIIEAVTGQISIDDQDVSSIGLHDLRSRLTVIPQDPILFSGNFRRNFDPLYKHSDDEIWSALELAHLKSFVDTLDAGLDHEIAEGGENLSVGQRQLVCLARALLRKSKILVLDEATAAVDVETDELIQQTIRSEFKNCTIITIAHRLNTIIDYDRILVLDNGRIIEFDAPSNLLENENSSFHSMAKEARLI